MFPTLAFVSLLAGSPVTLQGPAVTVRSLVQGSGSVIVFEHAADMGKVAGRKVAK